MPVHIKKREKPIHRQSQAAPVLSENKPVKRSQTELLMREVWLLLIKIVAIALAVVLIFTFMFGIYRSAEPSMVPAIKDGDLVIYYRLDKMYSSSDVLVTEYEGEKFALRVIATEGDKVDIREEGLYINGSLQLERSIYETTHRYIEGVDFPLTVGKGQVFVLGDSRENSTDSRIFGPVDIASTHGKVMTVIRIRSI